MKEITIKLMDVEKDGLPEPDGNKIYFVVHPSGSGYGTYDYETQLVGYEQVEISGKNFKLPIHKKTGKIRWYLDFDGVGHDDEINGYFEIPDEVWG